MGEPPPAAAFILRLSSPGSPWDGDSDLKWKWREERSFDDSTGDGALRNGNTFYNFNFNVNRTSE